MADSTQAPALALAPRTDDDRRQHPYCQECSLKTKMAGKDWAQTTKFCRGIYSDKDFEEISQLTNIDKNVIEELMDPSQWIYTHLGINPYWYQHLTLKCTSIRKTLRWGRRTGKTEIISAYLIYLCCTNANKKILCITPGKSHAKEINDRIHKLLNESIDVKGELVKAVQQPYFENSFANGSRIRIFVAGTSSGANAGTHVRGQEADILFIDEMDYIDDDATAAIIPILSDPERQGDPVQFIASSTPSGKEGLFYKLSTNSNHKEFHFPSHARPDWDDQKDAEAKELAKTQANYQHEYLAEWGTKSDGVFKRRDILRAQQEYRYHKDDGFDITTSWPMMKPFPGHWKYIMGVDWNGPGNGTRIAIIGYDYTRKKWILVYREAVNIEEFSLNFSIQRIVELNREWRCHAVYIDQGFGQMQDETLRAIGRAAELDRNKHVEHHDADILFANKLVTVDFGGWIEYKTTIEGKIVDNKIPMKNYMVENFQRFFENQDFWFSKSDAELKDQLMGYIIARQSSHGYPIYKADTEYGDHDLDAVMLSLYGFNQEFDSQFKKKDIMMDFLWIPSLAGPAPKIDPLHNPTGYMEEYKEYKKKIEESPAGRMYDVPKRDIAARPNQRNMMLPSNQMIMFSNKDIPKREHPIFGTRSNKPGSRTSWHHKNKEVKRGRRF